KGLRNPLRRSGEHSGGNFKGRRHHPVEWAYHYRGRNDCDGIIEISNRSARPDHAHSLNTRIWTNDSIARTMASRYAIAEACPRSSELNRLISSYTIESVDPIGPPWVITKT